MRCSHGRCKNDATPGKGTCESCRARQRERTLTRWLARDTCPRCGKDQRRFGQDICDACCQKELDELRATRGAGEVVVAGKPHVKTKSGKLRPMGRGRF